MSMHTLIQDTVDGLLVGSTYGVLSAGLALVFGVMRVVNFAQADIMMLAMYLGYGLITIGHIDPRLSIGVISIVFLAGGWALSRGLGKRLLSFAREGEVQVIFTLGLGVVLESLALMTFGADPKVINGSYGNRFIHLGSFTLSQSGVASVSVLLLIAALMRWFLMSTFVGRALRATEEDPEVASYMGIEPVKIYRIAFAVGIALAGLSGGLLVLSTPASPLIGQSFITVMFVAVIIGGMGSVHGALLGGLLIGLIGGISQVWLSPQLTNAVIFGLFLMLLVFRPQGLLTSAKRLV